MRSRGAKLFGFAICLLVVLVTATSCMEALNPVPPKFSMQEQPPSVARPNTNPFPPVVRDPCIVPECHTGEIVLNTGYDTTNGQVLAMPSGTSTTPDPNWRL